MTLARSRRLLHTARMRLEIVSVNIARPSVIGRRNGLPVRSAIGKRPVLLTEIEVAAMGLAGDAVADRRVHGGIDKAVYVYPSDHWERWTKQGFACAPGSFGENLTVKGADETMVRIGDRFRWGEALLEVSQPRSPCYKFQMFSGRDDAGALMTVSGRCGWYLRVVETARVTTSAPLVRESEGTGASVRETFHAAFNRRIDKSVREEIAAHPALAAAWRKDLVGR